MNQWERPLLFGYSYGLIKDIATSPLKLTETSYVCVVTTDPIIMVRLRNKILKTSYACYELFLIVYFLLHKSFVYNNQNWCHFK